MYLCPDFRKDPKEFEDNVNKLKEEKEKEIAQRRQDIEDSIKKAQEQKAKVISRYCIVNSIVYLFIAYFCQ